MNDPQKKYRLGTVSKNILLEGFIQFHGANLAINSDVYQDTLGKVTKHNITIAKRSALVHQVTTGLQGTDTTGQHTQDHTNLIQESQEVSPFPAGDHKATISRQESMANTKHTESRK